MAKKEKVVKEKIKLTKEEKKALKLEKKNNKESFFGGIRKEIKLVRWPLKKEMAKYSMAVLFFMLFLGLYFTIGDLIVAGLRTLVS